MINKALVLEYAIAFLCHSLILKKQSLLLRSARVLSSSQETLALTLLFKRMRHCTEGSEDQRHHP